MPVAKKLSEKKAKKSPPKKGATKKQVAVTGDERVKKITFTKTKAAQSKESKISIPKVTQSPILLSVSVDDGPAKVARYSGLFFMLVGACFACYSLSGLYVEMVELSTSNHFVTALRHQPAQLITANPLTEPASTTNTMTPSGTVPLMEGTTELPIPQQTTEANTTGTSSQINTNTTVSSTTASGQPLVTTTEDSSEEQQLAPLVLEPPVELSVSGGTPLNGVTDINIRVQHADGVELFLMPRTSLVERYLGRAVRKAPDTWMHIFDTRQVPNGEYKLFARIKNKYGMYRSSDKFLRVYNQPIEVTQPTTDSAAESEQMRTTISDVSTELEQREPEQDIARELKVLIAPPQALKTPQPTSDQKPPLVVASSSMNQSLLPTEPHVDPVVDEKAARFIDSFQSELRDLLNVYGVALRSGDEPGVLRTKERITELRRQSLDRVETELASGSATPELVQQVRDRISVLIEGAITRREKEERLILDRVGDKMKRDNDRDGISDYDEQNIYRTNPFVADTDADGFTDGAEVLSGYDPVSEAREVAVAFEDPREKGTEREDILSVSRLDILSEEKPASSTGDISESREQNKVIFSGKALPNSFVTLYIYSTPVVVTVKTNDDGSWNYAFDKELEDGQHEIYIGITDNAGKLIAKSKPLPFIKTANAYAVGRISEQPVAVPAPAQSLFSENALILTISLVVMLIGLVLVLIGAHLARHAKIHSAATLSPNVVPAV